MIQYRRNFLPSGTFFFTVTLVNRNSCFLVDQIETLRVAMRQTRGSQPFTIDAVVILS
jgi:putative transposase